MLTPEVLRTSCAHRPKMAKKEGPQKPREPLLVLNRGDRIRTCDLVLPKRTLALVWEGVFSHSKRSGGRCHGLSGPFRLVLSGF
jgi:hypothetical protein